MTLDEKWSKLEEDSLIASRLPMNLAFLDLGLTPPIYQVSRPDKSRTRYVSKLDVGVVFLNHESQIISDFEKAKANVKDNHADLPQDGSYIVGEYAYGGGNTIQYCYIRPDEYYFKQYKAVFEAQLEGLYDRWNELYEKRKKDWLDVLESKSKRGLV